MRPLFYGMPDIPPERLESNRQHTKTLGLPEVPRRADVRQGSLAIVGGGPSIQDRLDEIRQCAEVWAINGASRHLRERGIANAFVSVDASPIVARYALGADKAILCTRCDPSVFERVENAKVFDIANDDEDGIACGSSTATCCLHLSLEAGWRSVLLFGCESSFPEGRTHAYHQENRTALMGVECNGELYLTAPDFYTQALELSEALRRLPQVFRERSGGLLAALVRSNGEYEVTHLSNDVRRCLGLEVECSPSA